MRQQLKIIHPRDRQEQSAVILDVGQLHKRFTQNSGETKAVLENISFSARQGELICILGRSGCGKSTLLKLVAGFIKPDWGDIRLNGAVISKPGPERCMVFQEDALFPWLTVRENIAFGLKGKRIDPAIKEQEIDRFLNLVGLNEFSTYLPKEISGGMKQRVALARVLILKPQVLLMDEPFAALDAQTREEMQNLVLNLWRKLSHTILFVTHDVSEAILLADRILLLGKDPGRLEEDIVVDLPRPREKDDRRFIALSRAIKAKI